MEDKHRQWRESVAQDAEKELLRKIENILEHDYISSQDLDDLKDAWCAIHHMKEARRP